VDQLDGGGPDAVQARGVFDCRYRAAGRGDVPGDGVPHRITLRRGSGAARTILRAVPRETAEVFRSVELENPLGVPLLAGPVEVWAGGSLLATATLARTDRGARITVGMGVEERVRVTRRTRVEEDKAGLLGGSVAVLHTVTTEIGSSLGVPVTLELLDRVPVTDDKALEVKRVRASPEPVPWKPKDGAPLRGGLCWTLTLQPGTKQVVEMQYRLVFPAKQEITGGNRRD
jgi:uncharacterized protein (TIGR02231 family)